MENGMGTRQLIHPLTIRLTHWVNALAILVMIGSGWRIYDASPLFGFSFPPGITLGGWLAGALLWHFAMMWLLVLNGLVYLTFGLATGHFRRDFAVGPRAFTRDLRAAFSGRLHHALGSYNAVQRVAYFGVIIVGVVLVLSGLAVWKPVQLQALAALFGGYEGARRVHFLAMAAMALFIVVHVTLVALVPKTFLPMITGYGTVNEQGERREQAGP